MRIILRYLANNSLDGGQIWLQHVIQDDFFVGHCVGLLRL